MALLKYLKKLESQTIYFADNDEKKQGKKIGGILCIPRSEAEKIAGHSIILASPYRDTALYDDLRSAFPYVIQDVVLEILDFYPQAHGFQKFVPLGHFFSQYPDMDEIERKHEMLYQLDKEIKDINFHIETQMNLLERMKELLADKEAKLADKDAEIADKDAEIAALKRLLAEKQ